MTVPPRLGYTRGGDEPLVRFPADRREGDCQFIKNCGLSPKDHWERLNLPLRRTLRGSASYEQAIAPYVAQARKTFPSAKARFLAGLPPEEGFFVTTRLRDGKAHWEQVFIAVNRIDGDKISGVIASKINQVEGFKYGDRYSLSDDDVLDWLISKPDGSEEGNFVGKFLDTYRQ